jgi:hypothetical protein
MAMNYRTRRSLEASVRKSHRPSGMSTSSGLKPSEWLALEHCEVARDARIVYVRRAYRNARLKCPRNDASIRGVPLQLIALAALEEPPHGTGSQFLFQAPQGGYLQLHNSAIAIGNPPRVISGSRQLEGLTVSGTASPPSHSRAGTSTFDLSRCMGASLTMIDRHYGHLAHDGREHSTSLLVWLTSTNVHAVDARWTRGRGSLFAAAPKTSR